MAAGGQFRLDQKAPLVLIDLGDLKGKVWIADFFYTLRDSGLAIYAEPVAGFPPHHYAQKHPLPPGPGDVLYITRSPEGPDCAAPDVRPQRAGSWRPKLGFETREINAFRVSRRCWFPDGE